MKAKIILTLFLLKCVLSFGQSNLVLQSNTPYSLSKFKLFTRSYGITAGLQKGKYTFLDLGVEQHWRKIKLVKPRMFSLGMNMEYNLKYNILAYRFSFWMKRGRLNFTYGASLTYLTDFNESKIGISPNIGFRFLNFHLINGVNLYLNETSLKNYNTLYLSLRFFFPLSNKVKVKK